MNLQYKAPLHNDDVFVSRLAIRKEGLRYVFLQDIYRKEDNRLAFRATVELVCLVNGRLANSPEYDKAFGFIK